MSYEAWSEDDSTAPDGYVTTDEADEQAHAGFVAGAQACREMLARFVEQGGDAVTAASLRANWAPSWGVDPGRPEVASAVPAATRARIRWKYTIARQTSGSDSDTSSCSMPGQSRLAVQPGSGIGG